MTNRIPKTATKLEVTFLTDTSDFKLGDKEVVEKSEFGWISNHNGKRSFLFTAHLRNSHFCAIKIIA